MESRRAGLRGAKPEEAAHSSPDENRPSNEQSGAPEADMERQEPESNAESEAQAASVWTNGAHDQQDAGSYCNAGYQMEENGRTWGHSAAGLPAYQRSFAVLTDPASQRPNNAGPSTAFFT